MPEWIGVTPDTKIPKSVRLRVFARYGGICQLSGRAIRPGDDWDCDHIKALRNGGEHRESNLHPALKLPHQQKTVIDRNETAKTDRMKAKHLGIWPKSNAWNRNLKRKLDGTTVRRNP